MFTFGLIRHAQTRWNLEKKIQGREDTVLSSEGMHQARRWGKVLSAHQYDAVLSSPMTRARQTSRIISREIGADIVYDDGLKEQDFGAWEGRKITDIKKQAPGEIECQESRGWKFCPPGGESRILVLKRVLDTVKNAANRFGRKHVLVVSHHSVMKILIYHAAGRTFMPDESPLLKEYHLHMLRWSQTVKIDALNHIKL